MPSLRGKRDNGPVEWTVRAEVFEWRGPAPYFFLPMGHEDSADLKLEAAGLEYWGQVSVHVVIGRTSFTTAVFPKDGRYLVPLRASVRKVEDIEEGMPVTATIRVNRDRGAPRTPGQAGDGIGLRSSRRS